MIEKGDCIDIHFKLEDGCDGYAACKYNGRDSNGGYVFISLIYGWAYIINKEKTKVTWVYPHWGERKEHILDNRSGWANYLPN